MTVGIVAELWSDGDDLVPAVHPGATEMGSGEDDDCDGLVVVDGPVAGSLSWSG